MLNISTDVFADSFLPLPFAISFLLEKVQLAHRFRCTLFFLPRC